MAAPDLREFLCVTEVADGAWIAANLFRRKFGQSPPESGHHIVTFVQGTSGGLRAANYLHFWRHHSLGLLGGSCTDGNVRRLITAEQAALIRSNGGLMALAMGYAHSRFAAEGIEAFFAYCGDSLSLQVLRQLGYESAAAPHLQVWWPAPLSRSRQAELVAEAMALGPF